MHSVESHLPKLWSRISENPIAAAVVATLIAAAAIWAIDTAHEHLTKSPPPQLVERAEVTGGPWGPGRQLLRCMPNGRCLATDRVVLDSLANDPLVGNEAWFMRAKVLGSTDAPQPRVDVKIGDIVLVRALVENDAAMHTSDVRALTARGTRFNVSLPTNSSRELPLFGHISATNAAPRRIYATAFLHAKNPFSVEYVWGSTWLSNRTHQQLPLSDGIVGEGALVGSDKPDGTFAPCLCNGAVVSFLVRILPAGG